MPDPTGPIIACFAHERGDARVMKRVSAFQKLGWTVHGYMFHRLRDRVDPAPFWDHVELGITENRKYLKRLLVFLRSLAILWQHRQKLALADAFYVVNTDNALLALAGRWMSGAHRKKHNPSAPPAPLILELADVQPAMLGSGIRGRLMRAMERWVLAKTALLVTTSPGFVREYFTPLQDFTGRVFLLENRIYPSTGLIPPAPAAADPQPIREGRPWVVGLFGAFRCRRSIELMKMLAARFPDQLHFYLRGYPSGVDAPGIAALLNTLPNLEWAGAYQYPADLPDIYRRIDLNWTLDFSDPGTNSAWLLPNRIYEGGFFHCPALADAGTETGRWVTSHGVGWTVAEPFADSLTAFFETLTPASWQEKKAAAPRLPRAITCGEEDYQALSELIMELSGQAPPDRPLQA
ncbi:MAG: putative glucosyltransferase protein [Verrucomicrobiales bacterium]|nr:putative glucosyltransferase protein [Verrucomicrobiales bacterium]